jgi:hypothetical protein
MTPRADEPGVNLEAVSVYRVERYFWCNIVRRSTDGLLPFARTLNKRSKAKVANLDVHVRIKEKVAQFQITMDHLMGVHVMAGADQLYHEEPRFWLCKDTTSMEHAHERTVRAELQSHIDILLILEAIDKLNDVAMI